MVLGSVDAYTKAVWYKDENITKINVKHSENSEYPKEQFKQSFKQFSVRNS